MFLHKSLARPPCQWYTILRVKKKSLGNKSIIMKRKKGHYSISAVAEMFDVHQQTIRAYEKEGLISPKRSQGNTRLFSEEDVARLEEIIYLTHKLGVNLAGVELVLKQQRQIKKLQNKINTLFKQFEQELDEERIRKTQQASTAAQNLASLKKPNKKDEKIPRGYLLEKPKSSNS